MIIQAYWLHNLGEQYCDDNNKEQMAPDITYIILCMLCFNFNS